MQFSTSQLDLDLLEKAILFLDAGHGKFTGTPLELSLARDVMTLRARLATVEAERDAARAKNDVTSIGISALIRVYEAADRLAEECDEDTWEVEEVRMRDLHSALEDYEEIAENGGAVENPITQLTKERDAARAEAESLRRLLDGYIASAISVRDKNTPEWMAGFAEDTNRTLEAIGDDDRVLLWEGNIYVKRLTNKGRQ